MCIIIVIVVIVLLVLYCMGIFNKPANCQCCGTLLKGTQQVKFGEIKSEFILCKNCSQNVHPFIKDYAQQHWSYSDFEDYLAWEEETKDERSQFKSKYSYGSHGTVQIDTERGLFKIKDPYEEEGMVFRFEDLNDYDIDFKPEDMEKSFMDACIMGEEYIMVDLIRPSVRIEETLDLTAIYSAKKKGILSSKYEYNLEGDFVGFIRTFTTCVYLEQEKQNAAWTDETGKIDEIQKALALFMFDSMEDVTIENLKKQRNTLIKAFHPDNNESDEHYSQKINAAYELLQGMIQK